MPNGSQPPARHWPAIRFAAGYEEEVIMKWDTPDYSDIRFGFEVTMYINNK